MTFKCRVVCLAVFVWLLCGTTIVAQSLPQYRQFVLGSSVASIVEQTGADPSTLRTVHQRPAVMTELEWRPRFQPSGGSTTDPVELMVFRFYDDQLFMIAVDYDRRRTEGMTPRDMIDAISLTYGVPQLASRVLGSNPGDLAAPAPAHAIWVGAAHSIALTRIAYPESYRLVITHTQLERLARAGNAEAVQLDAAEAPERELARQRQIAAKAAAELEKAKTNNKAGFKP